MSEERLKEIREYISCPQFGDNHYGRYGALNLEQRKSILELYNEVIRLRKIVVEANDILRHHKHDLDYEPWSEYKISGNILFDLAIILKGE